jgi:hypothetical protein
MAHFRFASEIAAEARASELAAAARRSTAEDRPPPQEDGDVRRIEGRLVSRRQRRCPLSGAEYWALYECDFPPVYGPWEERLVGEKLIKDREVLSPGRPGERWEVSPSEAFRGLAGRVRLRPWDPWRPPLGSEGDEVLRLLGEYPLIGPAILRAADLDPPGEPPEGLFPIGACSITDSPGARFRLDAKPFVLRHMAGDLGIHGDLRGEPSEGERFAPCLFGARAEGHAALHSGHGIIQSMYFIGDPGRDASVLRIATLLVPGRPGETIVWTNHDKV